MQESNFPPYSPDFNPIEEFFAELKAYITKARSVYEENPGQGFMPSFGGVYMKLVQNRTVPKVTFDMQG
ncbi:hypothetical protein N7539_008667 [Penicillium diatomitis]|uniref:Tc1-like transposase DDE domain-containing protein n=1 Tax=Penicillium diatomitis TaxID=2819901 RepID=A0A9W9WRQ5_9EURO|nr:uncharacterized protein N7539_008667 [Penicillium diatomitis]KAJ5472098.1 hypothetical protein N7539_008667 [Penicillium diatomitis]